MLHPIFSKSDITFPRPKFDAICLNVFKDIDHLTLSDIPAKCQLSRKIQRWRMLRKHELTFEDGVKFINEEPHWPLRPETIPMLEKKITSATSKKIIKEWFVQHAPKTFEGMDAFMGALGYNERNHRQFIMIFKNFWLLAELTLNEQKILLKKYGNLLTAKDHQERVERLLWKEKTETASDLLRYLQAHKRAVYQEWINLIHRKSRLMTSTHPGIATVLAQYALRGQDDIRAYTLLLTINPKRVFHLHERYFHTVIRTVRNLIERKDYPKAFELCKKGLALSSVEVNSPYLEELYWLTGWILTAYLNQPLKGFKFLISAASLSTSSAEKAQYAFWAAQAAKKSGKSALSTQWLKNAVQLPHTFYGQLAAKQLNQDIHLKAYQPKPHEIEHFMARDIIKAIQFLHETHQHGIKNVLLNSLQDNLKTTSEYILGFYFTKAYSTPYYTIHYYEKVNKLHNLITPDVFLRIHFKSENFDNHDFIHAMAFNESRFHPMIKSDMGALGLMQITPLTGRHLANQGHSYEEDRLYTDPVYNLTMGTIYLKELFNRFDQSYLLLAAAYNAGPTYLSKWLQRYGAPKHDFDHEWIEELAYKETRDYVKKLLGMMHLYKKYGPQMQTYTPDELMQAYKQGCLSTNTPSR